jgi:hypothetical protein
MKVELELALDSTMEEELALASRMAAWLRMVSCHRQALSFPCQLLASTRCGRSCCRHPHQCDQRWKLMLEVLSPEALLPEAVLLRAVSPEAASPEALSPEAPEWELVLALASLQACPACDT